MEFTNEHNIVSLNTPPPPVNDQGTAAQEPEESPGFSRRSLRGRFFSHPAIRPPARRTAAEPEPEPAPEESPRTDVPRSWVLPAPNSKRPT